jgi:hypothetical protein
MTYPVYHAHKSTKLPIAKSVARALAKPVAFTFLGMVLCAIGTNHHLMAEQQANADAKTLVAMMDGQQAALLPPPVFGR